MIGPSPESLADQLRRERRSCPACSLEVESPLIERCPRCFALLPKSDVHCEGCVHRILCPAVRSAEGAPRPG